MARSISKNAKRSGAQVFTCHCGGEIGMKTTFAKGKLKHYAKCANGHEARRPKLLMRE